MKEWRNFWKYGPPQSTPCRALGSCLLCLMGNLPLIVVGQFHVRTGGLYHSCHCCYMWAVVRWLVGLLHFHRHLMTMRTRRCMMREMVSVARYLVIYQTSQTVNWLPIEVRISFKLASLTLNELDTSHLPYLADLLQYHKHTKSARSSASHLLSVPWHNLSFGFRAFCISVTTKYGTPLPPHILQSQTLSSFRRYLETHYFQSAYPAP